MAEIYKLQGPVGLNTTKEPSDLSNAPLWTGGNNVQFRNGIAQKVSGYEEGLGPAAFAPECLVPLRETDTYNWVYIGNSNIPESPVWSIRQISSLNNHQDATPTTPISTSFPEGTEYQWTGDTVNGVPYLTNGVPYYYDSSLDKFKMFDNIPRDIANVPRVRFKTIRTYKNILVGMCFYTDDYEGDVGNGWGPWSGAARQDNGVWWSHPIIGKEVDTDWKDADPLKSSGWNFLGGAGGPVVDGKALRDSFMLYRERSVWQMIYVGGVNVMAFKEVFDDAGVLGLDCVLEVEGQHIVVGQSDVYIHNGVQKKSIAEGVIRRELFESIDPTNQSKVFIVGDYQNKNAWICIPDVSKDDYSGDGSCNTAFIYNWEDGSWSKRDLPNITTSIYTILSIADTDLTWEAPEEGGPVDNDGNSIAPVLTGATWEEASDTWAETGFKYNPAQWGIAYGSRDGSIYTQIKNQTFNGENFEAFIEKTGIDMESPWVSKNISRIVPLVRGGEVDIYGSGSYPIEGQTWKKLGTFDPTTDTHLSCRFSGRYIGLRVVIPEKSRASVRGIEVEFTPQGRR